MSEPSMIGIQKIDALKLAKIKRTPNTTLMAPPI